MQFGWQVQKIAIIWRVQSLDDKYKKSQLPDGYVVWTTSIKDRNYLTGMQFGQQEQKIVITWQVRLYDECKR